jgi:hypothetical protein
MSGIETALLIGGTVASVVAGGAAAAASIYAGNQTRDAAYEAARRDERAGRDEFAAAQREAQERKLEGELILSRQQAIAAASGAGAGSDAPTIVRLMTETAKRSRYGMETAMYQGRSRRQTYFDSAESRRKTGDASFLGSIFTGIGQFAEGFA